MQPGNSTAQDNQPSNLPVPSGSAPSTPEHYPSTNGEGPVQSEWSYREEDHNLHDELNPISWSASEYIDHEKPVAWFIGVGAVAAVVASGIYLLTRHAISSIVIVLVAGMFAATGARKPRILNYGLDLRGIHIGNRLYDYNSFRSFSVMNEGGLNSIELFQFKRFTTPITLYYPPDQEKAIVNFLGSYLPREVRSHDPIDRLMRRVRF